MLDHVRRFPDFCNMNGRAPLSYTGLGTLIEKILRFGPSELKGPALYQWQRGGVEWDNVDKAKKQYAKVLAKAKKDDARAKKEATKKRAREVYGQSEGVSEEKYPQQKIPRTIARPPLKQMDSSYLTLQLPLS